MARFLDFDFLDLPSESDSLQTLGAISFTATVRQFPMRNPWVYVAVPNEYIEKLLPYRIGSLIPITATTGGSQWETSLAPIGKTDPNHSHFIPLKAAIRKAESIKVGDKIKISFEIRKK